MLRAARTRLGETEPVVGSEMERSDRQPWYKRFALSRVADGAGSLNRRLQAGRWREVQGDAGLFTEYVRYDWVASASGFDQWAMRLWPRAWSVRRGA